MTVASFETYIRDLLDHPDVQRLKEGELHHFRRSRFVHSYAVAKLSYRIARLTHANAAVAARGGMLHDWYHDHDPHYKKWLRPDTHHFRKAVEAARAYGEAEQVIQTIRTHYWPYGRELPQTREAWIVWLADNIIWLVDWWQSVKITIREKLTKNNK